jgi:membrane fusion protein (multidrug efflux system)
VAAVFSRAARSLDGGGCSAVFAALAGTALLAGWTVWFLVARVSVYEVSRSARVEAETAPHEIDTPVAGRVVKSALVLGRMVAAGEVLVELEADRYRLEREGALTELRGLAPQIEALRRELLEQERAVRGEGQVAASAAEEERARQRAAEALARLKTDERAQLEALQEQAAVSALETARTSAEAQQHQAETEARQAALGRLGSEKGLRVATRRAGIARIQQELARLEGQHEVVQARVRLLDQEIALRVVRAPITGRTESVVDLQPGSVVEAGARLASLVPAGGLRAVAFYDPATSVGRVRAGERARLRLLGFSWTKYGSIPAVVNRVGNEPKDGEIRVELLLLPNPGSRIPLQHGMPASAEIEVERVSPASLVLDAAGRFLTRADESRPAAGP